MACAASLLSAQTPLEIDSNQPDPAKTHLPMHRASCQVVIGYLPTEPRFPSGVVCHTPDDPLVSVDALRTLDKEAKRDSEMAKT